MEHIDYIKRHYYNATGIINPSNEELNEFIQTRQNQFEIFLTLAKYLTEDNSVCDKTTLEFGKTGCVSIAKYGRNDILTQYPDSFGKTKNHIITGSLETFGSLPIILSETTYTIDTKHKLFMTHNPLNTDDLITLLKIYHSNKDILLGLYGSIHDKNYETTMELLKEYRSLFTQPYLFEQIRVKDTYAACIAPESEYVRRK